MQKAKDTVHTCYPDTCSARSYFQIIGLIYNFLSKFSADIMVKIKFVSITADIKEKRLSQKNCCDETSINKTKRLSQSLSSSLS